MKGKRENIPEATIRRLMVYYQYIKKIDKKGQKVISSKTLAEKVGTISANVRKDLSYFGEFGCRGKGYEVHQLKDILEEILKIDRIHRAILIGAGNLGRALLNYPELKEMGVKIIYVFDNDLNKIDNKIGDMVVKNIKDLERIIINEDIEMGIIAVPESEAQQVADKLVNAGIKGIWNFAPAYLELPDEVNIKYERLGPSVATLIYKM